MKSDVSIYSDLITSLKTTREADNFSAEIDMIISSLFKSEKVLLEKALASISSNSAKKITEIFLRNNLDMTDKEFVHDFLHTLKNLIKKFKVIKLILAFDPANKTIENVHNFVTDTVGTGYILDIEISEEILGGAIVIFDGKYNDFSLKKKIEDAFAFNNKEILQFYK